MNVLVTGATGFLGGCLSRRLHGMGWRVTALGRNARALAALESAGIEPLPGDLADSRTIGKACQGKEVVFHCGAFSAPWGKAADFYRANVVGTENVISGCQAHGVQRLVHVSTPGIYFRHQPRFDIPEDAELPRRQVNEYARTKLLAESRVDQAGAAGLSVITIRPRAIIGPGDTSILPRLIDRLATGRLRIIGDGLTVVDLTCVENVVDALLLCASSPASTLGKKYNITNGEPVVLWDTVQRLADALGYALSKRHISYGAAHAVASVLELFCRLLPQQPEPPLTRYTVGVLALSTTLDITAAKRDLGYQPGMSTAEGLDAFVRWWKTR